MNSFNKICIQFLIKLNEIDNLELNVKALSIIKYQKDLNNEECKIIYNFFVNLPIDKFNEMTSLKEQMNFIPAFLLKSIKDKIIEIEDFYKDTIEVNGMLNIFNFYPHLKTLKLINIM
jgi:hypothetical protein